MLGHVHKFLRVLRTLFAFEIITQPLPAARSLGYWTNRLVGAGSWLIPPPIPLVLGSSTRTVRPTLTRPDRSHIPQSSVDQPTDIIQAVKPKPVLFPPPPFSHTSIPLQEGGGWEGEKSLLPPPLQQTHTHPPDSSHHSTICHHSRQKYIKIFGAFLRVFVRVCACVFE